LILSFNPIVPFLIIFNFCLFYAVVPFIDVGVDWIDSPTCLPISGGKTSRASSKSDDDTKESWE